MNTQDNTIERLTLEQQADLKRGKQLRNMTMIPKELQEDMDTALKKAHDRGEKKAEYCDLPSKASRRWFRSQQIPKSLKKICL